MAAEHLPQPGHESIPGLDDALALEIFWEKHRNSIFAGIAALIVAGLGFSGWLVYSHNRQLSSEQALATAADPAAWEAVARDFSGTPAAGNALTFLAAAQRAAGKLDESTATYQRLVADYADYPLMSGALLGIAQNDLLAGKGNAYADALADIRLRFASTYVAPYALLAGAEYSIRANRPADARKQLQTLLTDYAASPIAQVAAPRLQGLDQTSPAAAPQSPGPAKPVAP